VLNHLWQSTAFAVVAWLLTLGLKGNRAQTRYWVWFAASMKFFVPFALLAAAGSQVSWRTAPPLLAPTVIEQVTRVSAPFAAVRQSGPAKTNPMPELLLLAWGCGFLGIVLRWGREWTRMHVNVRSAKPVDLGLPVPARSSAALIEPGVFGVLRPVLLLPEGITERLTPAQLNAILVHELCHVRRRDNLATAIHMVVEAVFWFHPLVWWIGARLLEERERVCDEEVLRGGNDAQTYAEGILKVCEFYLRSPLVCVAGVSGANLNKRIEEIMSNRTVVKLNAGRKLLLTSAGMLVVAGPVAIGIVNAPPIRAQAPTAHLEFEVASVKPNKSDAPPSSNFPLNAAPMYAASGGLSLFSATNFPLVTYIFFAYNLTGNQAQRLLSQLPAWAMTERFDIQARAAASSTKDQMRLMMRSLLAERFKFASHTEQREAPVLAVVLAKPGETGPRLQPHPADAPCQTSVEALSAVNPAGDRFSQWAPGVGFPPICNSILGIRPSVPGRFRLGGRNVTIGYMADMFGQRVDLGRPMIDASGLTGTFDFLLEFAADSRSQVPTAPGLDAAPDPDGPTFEQALRDQLGLKLDRRTGSMQVMVLDQVERPTAN